MNTLRELDAWIHEHVFGIPVCDKPAMTELPEKCNKFEIANHIAIDECPHYTTSPADSMEVLKRCAEKCPRLTVNYIAVPKSWMVGIPDGLGRFEIGPTLEIALAKFARALHESTNKKGGR